MLICIHLVLHHRNIPTLTVHLSNTVVWYHLLTLYNYAGVSKISVREAFKTIKITIVEIVHTSFTPPFLKCEKYPKKTYFQTFKKCGMELVPCGKFPPFFFEASLISLSLLLLLYLIFHVIGIYQIPVQ